MRRASRYTFLLVTSLSVACSGRGCGTSTVTSTPGSLAASATNATTPINDPISSIDQWRKDTFAGRDPRKLWQQYSQAAQAQLAGPGADPSDITAKANALGRDPQKIFEFLRDHIAFDPYAGVLRGARGTLVAGGGNALDRSLLAQELLKAEGIESRLVAGKLSEVQADGLYARFLSGPAVPQILADLVGAPDEIALKSEAADLSGKIGLPEHSIKDLLQHARAHEQEFWTKTKARRSTQFDLLRTQLQRGGAKMAIDRAALSKKLKERLREHYWLQIREPDGGWTEFDPAFSDAKRGRTYGSDPMSLSEVPKDKYHQLEFSLVYQTVTDGATREDVLVNGAFLSADALFAPLEFRIQPAVDLDEKSLSTMNGKQKIDVLRRLTRFRALLRAGSKITTSRVFDLEGNVSDVTGDAPGSLLKPSGGDPFGDALGGGVTVPPKFVELKVVMRLTGPDRVTMRQTRTLVRASDIKAPTFAPPMLEWDVFLQPQWVPVQLVQFQALSQILAMGNALMKVSSPDRAPVPFEPPPSIPVLLSRMALLRQTAAADILANHDDMRALVDEPMLTISGHRLSAIRDREGRIMGERVIDIVENGVRYVAKDDAGGPAAFDAALQQGVADCTIEDQLLQEAFPDAGTQSGTTIVERAQLERRTPILANAHDVDKLRNAGVTEGDIEWIHDNESPAVRLVVATTTNGSGAWWSVRPDGNAILRAKGGRGQVTLENAILAGKSIGAIVCGFEIFHGIREEVTEGSMSGGTYFGIAACSIASLGGAGLLMAGHGVAVGVVGAHAILDGAAFFIFGLEIGAHVAQALAGE